MDDVYCYAYVEDIPSAAVVQKLVTARNNQIGNDGHRLVFNNGFPAVLRGFGNIKNKCEGFLKMALANVHTIILTDLDTAECACTLIRNWFNIPQKDPITLPPQCVFRVAVREVESWILADYKAWAEFIGISEANFSKLPDELDDPKEYLLNVIRRKGRNKVHQDMLPKGCAHIGPRYNAVLCDFVDNVWKPERAAKNSPSLERALRALMSI